MLISGALCFIFGVVLGGYRQFCMYVGIRHGSWDVPYVWNLLAFRIISWLVVAATSVWGAAVMALLSYAAAQQFAPKLANATLIIGFVFGAALSLRYLLSALVALRVFFGRI
jgi:hypothetical protein